MSATFLKIPEIFKPSALIRKGCIATRDENAFIHSIEGGIYLVEIESHGVSQWVENETDGRPRRFSCLSEAKQHARKLGVQQIRIALDTPYDEMIGLASCS